FYLMLSMLLFLAINGHLVMLDVLASSFDVMPVSELRFSAVKFMDIALLGGWMFAAGLLMALPAVTSLLVVNLAFGVMTKAAPQLNIFAIGFPFTMTLGLVITWLSLPGFGGQFDLISSYILEMAASLLKVSNG
ncbi:flagellar biosynthetic protein FliR, partial [Neptunomonas phycophila]|uniref:flagellar biosynthetic protein FliR n=1 Tax=Neptunomonas phycophila TaxID=1572645 RepID=UPI0023F83454